MVFGILLAAIGAYIIGAAAKSAYDAMKSGRMEKDLQEDPFSWGLVGQIYLLKKQIDKFSQSTSIRSEEHEQYKPKISYPLPTYHKPSYQRSITPYYSMKQYAKPTRSIQTYSWTTYKANNYKTGLTTDPLEEQIKRLVRS